MELDILFGIRIIHTNGVINIESLIDPPNFQSTKFVDRLGARLINLRRLRFCACNSISSSNEAALRNLCPNLTEIIVQMN